MSGKKGLLNSPEIVQSQPDKIPSQQEMEDFLGIHLPPPDGQTLLIKPLWDNHFRLNYYKRYKEEHQTLTQQKMVSSKFVTVIVTADGSMDVNIM